MEFVSELYQQLEHQLDGIAHEDLDNIEAAKRSYLAAEKAMVQLKSHIVTYSFTNAEEEINFFKILKPKFYSRLIYYVKVYEIEGQKTLRNTRSAKKYFNKYLASINRYTDEHLAFYKYINSGATYLDSVYFTRATHDLTIGFDLSYFDCNENFCSNHDLTLATLMANEWLSDFLNIELGKLKASPSKVKATSSDNLELSWAETKASFIELLYGLQTLGVFYNTKTKAKADMSQVARFFETTLSIDLGNYYRTFQEIRIRKKGRTVFIDKLREQLIQRMDEADENPRYN